MPNKPALLIASFVMPIAGAALLWPGATVTSGPPSGTFSRAGSSLVLTGASPGNSIIQRCTLESGKDYAVDFEAAATGPARITVGFWVRSPEKPLQTVSVQLGDSGDMTHFRRVLNPATAAGDAELRISSDWNGRWLVRDLRVSPDAPVRITLAWLALAIALLVVLRFQYRRLIPPLLEAARKAFQGVNGSVPWPVVMIGLIALACFVRDLAYTHPFVFGDEGEYAALSRFAAKPGLLAGNQVLSTFPNLLYFNVYHFAFYFGENFAAAVKFLNAVFWGTGLLAIYGVLRRFLTQRQSAFAIAVIGVGPISVYGAVFMPEMMHFCAFSVMAYMLVTRMNSRFWPAAAMAGVVLGADTLIKPHGLLLVFPVLLTLILLKLFSGSEYTWKACAKSVAALLGSIAASIMALSYMLTGQFISGLGGTYSPMVGRTIGDHSPGAVLLMVAKHFGALCSLYALPLALIAAALLLRSAFLDQSKAAMLNTLLLLTTTSLLTLLFTTSQFTVAIAKPGTLEYANRLHGRYYFFLLPWILASFFAVYPALDRAKPQVRRVLAFCLVGTAAISLYSILQSSQSAFMFFIDYPEIFWFYAQHSAWRYIVLGVTLGTLAIYLVRDSCRSFLFGLGFGLLGLIGTVWTTQFLLALPPTAGDEAAAVFRPLIAADARDNGAVIVTDPGNADFYRLLFHMPDAYDLVVNTRRDPLSLADVANDRQWVVVSGQHEAHFPRMDSVAVGPYALYFSPAGLNPVYSAAKAAGDQKVDLAKVPKDDSFPLWNVDFLGAESQKVGSLPQEVKAGAALYATGWAVDKKNNLIPGAVQVVLDQVVYDAHTGVERPDVAAYFKNRRLARAGYTLSIDGTAITPGRHNLRVRVFANDYSVFWESAPVPLEAR